jgi:hypothetical protein
MGHHDTYGKGVLRQAAGAAFQGSGPAVRFRFGVCRGWADIDGVVGDRIAVEIESRNSKQVRGAVLDLIWHPYPKKLLVLLPAGSMSDPCAEQCRYIFSRYLKVEDYRVILLSGTGIAAHEGDAGKVRVALRELGFQA